MKLLGVSLLPKVASVMAAFGLSLFVVDCLDTRSDIKLTDAGPADAGSERSEADADGSGVSIAVTVDVSAELAVVAPNHFGMHASVYDNALARPEVPDLLREAGIALLRWPGGGYSDNYHWSDHSMTPFSDGAAGYLGPASDFGAFVGLVDRVGAAVMITVNYGSNLQGDGPGEPKEAAAWVAYANGDPDDPHVIGVDGAGNDWQTVGYWASLRASEPEAEDDGLNFLRIARPEPLGIQYWEVGNEVFGNGFHEDNGSDGFELDLHVPYPGEGDDPDAGEFDRFKVHELSGTTYGEGVRAYVDEMKLVDPSIKVGAVLGTPPADHAWMSRTLPQYYWNDDVLSECGPVIDFAIVHWYPNPPNGPPEPTENTLFRLATLLTYPRAVMPVMVSMLRETIDEFSEDNAENIEIVMTEVGTGMSVPQGRNGGIDRGQAMGMYAANMYLTAAEEGFTNVDWLELHNGTFLSERTQAKGPAFSGIQMARLLVAPGDRLVSAQSDNASLIAHASVRDDGRFGVLLINTQAPALELRTAMVTIDFGGANVAASGERYDYLPLPNPMTDGGVPEGGVPEGGVVVGDGGIRLNATSGSVTGPTAFSDIESAFTVEVAPYGVTVLLFDAAD